MSACPAPPAATRSGVFSALSHDQAEAALTLARGGTVSAAADAIGVHRSSIYNWFKTDPNFKQAIEEIRRDRNDRLMDDIRHLESLAISRLRHILEDGSVPAAVQLRAALTILTRPKPTAGMEEWNLPRMESLRTTIDRRPSVAEPPAFDTTRHFSTLFEDSRRESRPPGPQGGTDRAAGI
ncbi:MAG: helix-turn-helix domain-containing protein [Acidobacteriota bacterium]